MFLAVSFAGPAAVLMIFETGNDRGQPLIVSLDQDEDAVLK